MRLEYSRNNPNDSIDWSALSKERRYWFEYNGKPWELAGGVILSDKNIEYADYPELIIQPALQLRTNCIWKTCSVILPTTSFRFVGSTSLIFFNLTYLCSHQTEESYLLKTQMLLTLWWDYVLINPILY